MAAFNRKRVIKYVILLMIIYIMGYVTFLLSLNFEKSTNMKRNRDSDSKVTAMNESTSFEKVSPRIRPTINSHLEDLELYMRMTSRYNRLHYYYDKLLVRSMRYFWPDDARMTVVLDGEWSGDHEFGDTISKKYPYPKICYMDNVDPSIYLNSGHERMQRDMFYPEECVSTKYVGYIDTDTLFLTRVTRELLFEDGKPVIIGVYGNITNENWVKAAESTYRMFKTREVMRCMSYFPVIFQVKHVVQMRTYLQRLHNKSFDEIFRDSHSGFLAQFNMMCQYVWQFHREEYSFHFQFRPLSHIREWKTDQAPGRKNSTYYDRVLTHKLKLPYPRVSLHYPHYVLGDGWKSQETYRELLRNGLCFSGGYNIDLCQNSCKRVRREMLRKELYVFEEHDWSWDDRCLDEQKRFYKLFEESSSPEVAQIIEEGCNEVETLKWKVYGEKKRHVIAIIPSFLNMCTLIFCILAVIWFVIMSKCSRTSL